MDELIRAKLHEALDVEKPDSGLRSRIVSSLPVMGPPARRFRTPSLRWAAGLVAGLLAVAVVASLVYSRGALHLRPQSGPAAASPSPTPMPPLSMTTAAFPDGEVGLAYSPVALSATGGSRPYRWTVSQGALPGGLTVSADATLGGTPTTAGDFNFSLQVTDANGSTATMPAASVKISPALSASLVPTCARVCHVEQGCANVCGNFGGLSGGVEPYKTAFVSGTIPSGMTLSGFSLIGSFPTVVQSAPFTVSATDALGATVTISPTFNVFPHIAFLAPASALCQQDTAAFPVHCSGLSYAGGTPCATPAVSIASSTGSVILKTASSGDCGGGGITLTASCSTGSGTPCGGTVYLVLTDTSWCGSGVHCSSGQARVDISIVSSR